MIREFTLHNRYFQIFFIYFSELFRKWPMGGKSFIKLFGRPSDQIPGPESGGPLESLPGPLLPFGRLLVNIFMKLISCPLNQSRNPDTTL
jgi:hypothetical protein